MESRASTTTQQRDNGVAGTGGYNTANSITGSPVTYGQNGAAATSSNYNKPGTGIVVVVGGYNSGNGGNGTAKLVVAIEGTNITAEVFNVDDTTDVPTFLYSLDENGPLEPQVSIRDVELYGNDEPTLEYSCDRVSWMDEDDMKSILNHIFATQVWCRVSCEPNYISTNVTSYVYIKSRTSIRTASRAAAST